MPKPKPSKPVLLAVSFKQFYFLKGIAEFTFKQILMLKGSLRFTLKQSCALKRIAVVVSLSFVFGLSYLVSWSPAPVYASTANTINFQARLETATGAIVPDGTYNAEFKLYNASSSSGSSQGSCSGDVHCLWFEDYLVTGTPVSVANGYMTVNLGSQTAFPNTIPWGSSLYLGINIGGTGSSPTWDGEMSPRLTLTAVPAAFSLESAAGSLTSTLNFVQPTTSESILLPAESGTTEYVCYQNDATNCGYIANQSTQQTSANFNISGEGQVATLDATGSGSANTLAIGAGATYTGAINIDTSSSVTTGTITVGGTAQTGNIVLGQYNGSSSSTINIGDNAGSSSTQNVNIANSSNGTNNVTIGSTNSAGQTKLQAGATSETIANTGDTIKTSTNSSTAFQVQNASAEPIFQVSTTTNNLVSNPGFEVNTTGWAASGSGASITRNTTVADTYDSQDSLAVTLGSGSGTGASTNTFTSSPAAGNYTFSFFAMGSASLTGLAVAVAGGSAPTCTLNSTTVSSSGFQEYYCSFTTSGSAITSLTITVTTASQTLYIDAVQLTNTTTLNPYQIGSIQLRGVITNPQVFEASSNSTTAFQVQNATGSDTLDIDTTNNAIVLGQDGSPSNMTVRGAQASGNNANGGNITFEASDGTGSGGSGSFIFQTGAPSGSALALDNSGTDSTTSNSMTLSYTTGSESNRLMMVQATMGCGNSVSSMTYDGATLTPLSSGNSPGGGCSHTEVWYKVAPANGTYNIVVNLAGSDGTIDVSTFYNVAQTGTFGSVASNTGTTTGTQNTSLNVTATSTAQLVYDAISTDESCSISGSPGTGQTLLSQYNACTGLYAGGTSYKQGTNGTVNMTWPIDSADWIDIGVPINAVANSSADSLTNSLVIASSGDVGVDVTSPTQTLSVGGTTLLQSTANSSSALQVENSAGNNLLTVDTSGNNINIGSTGSTALATTSNIGTSTGAAQTVNIGSSNINSVATIQGGGLTTETINASGATINENSSSTFNSTLTLEQSGSGNSVINFDDNSTGNTFTAGEDTGTSDSFNIASTTSNGGSVTTTGTPLANGSSSSTYDSGNANMLSATEIETTTAGSVKTLRVYIGNADTGAHMEAALYANDPGGSGLGVGYDNPGTLLAHSSSVSLTTNNTWYSFTIPSTAVTANTDYWIAFNTDDNSVTYYWSGASNGTLQNDYSEAVTYNTWTGNASPYVSQGNGNNGSGYSVNMDVSTPGGNLSTPLLSLTQTGQATFANSSNSTSAFQIQNAGGTNLLNVDTSGGNVNLGIGGTLPSFGYTTIGGTADTGFYQTIHASRFTATYNGTISSLSVYVGASGFDSTNKSYQVAIYTDTTCSGNPCPGAYIASSAVGTLGSTAGWYTLPVSAALTAGATYWLAYWSNTSSANTNKNAESYNFVGGGNTNEIEASTATTWQCSSSCTNGMPSTFPANPAIANYTYSIYATYATGNYALSLNSSGSLLATDAATFEDATNSTTAFQIQNASGKNVLGADTTDGWATLGSGSSVNGALLFNNSTNNNTIELESGATASNYSLVLPTTAPSYNQCLQTGTSSTTQLQFGPCSSLNVNVSKVGEWDNHGNSVTSQSVNVSPTKIGDELIVQVGTVGSGIFVTGVSGGDVTSWQKVTNATGTDGGVDMWMGQVTSTTPSTALTATVSGTATHEEVTAMEFTASGVSSATSWIMTADNTNYSTSTGTTVTWPSLLSTYSQEAYVGYASAGATPNTISTPGFTSFVTGATNMLIWDSSTAVGTTYSPTTTITSTWSETIGGLLAAFDPSSIANSTATQSANFNVQAATSGTVAGVLQGNTSGTADILDIENGSGSVVDSFSSTGLLNSGLSGTPTFVAETDNEATNLNTLSITTHALGNLVAVAFKLNAGNRVSAVSGGDVSQWHLVTYNNGTAHEEIWEGIVTTVGTATVTGTYINPSPSFGCELAEEEFSSTYGSSVNWFVTTSNDIVNGSASTTITYPSLTANETGGMYLGYGVTGGTGSAGSTSGFTYKVTTTGKNVLAYDTTISSGTTYSPTATTTSAVSDGVAMIAIPFSSAGTINVIGATELNGPVTSAVTFAPTQNMETAFQVQNSSGVNAFNVDTQDNIITSGDTLQVGPGVGTTTPKFLYLADVTSNAAGNPLIIGQWDNSDNWGIGPNSDSTSDNALRIGTTTGNGVNTWSTTQNVSLVVAGTEKVQPTTGNDSLTAFQVLTAGSVSLLTVDTSGDNVVIGSTTANSNAILLELNDYNQLTDPTGVTGGMYYNSSMATFRCYQGGVWRNCGGLDGDDLTEAGFMNDDFLNASASAGTAPWTCAALTAGGTFAASAVVPGHVGVDTLATTAATSTGYQCSSGTIFQLGGGETYETLFEPLVFSGTTLPTFKLGFNSTTWAAGLPGANSCYIIITSPSTTGQAVGQCTRASVVTSTTSNITSLAANTWYLGKLQVNSNASAITFSIYNATTGVLLWTDSSITSANMPASGTSMVSGFVGYATGNSAITSLDDLDNMSFYYNGYR